MASSSPPARPAAAARLTGRRRRAWPRCAWALPCSALGLAAGALLALAGARARRVDGTLEIGLRARQHEVPRWARACPFGAITLGHVIVGQSHEMLARLRAHEQVHVRQYERWGALFLLAYPLASLWAGLHGGDPYRDNVFEREAVRGEGRG
jgi:hypothetical protein